MFLIYLCLFSLSVSAVLGVLAHIGLPVSMSRGVVYKNFDTMTSAIMATFSLMDNVYLPCVSF